MRIRTIKPQFFINEELAQCSALARLFFIGTWGVADKEGRLEDRPARLKVEILPYDDADPTALIDELEQGGFLRRYSANGGKYLWVVKFKQHQRITGKEAERTSTLPEPPADCLSLPLQNEQTEPKRPAKRKPTGTDPDFDVFWAAYPKKEGKADALKAWGRNGRAELPVLLKALEAQKGSEQWSKNGGKYIPHASTWLNGRRWEDEVAAGPGLDEPAPARVHRNMTKEEEQALMREVCQ